MDSALHRLDKQGVFWSMERIKKVSAALVCVLFLALPGAALAQSSSGTNGYEEQGSAVQGVVNADDNGGGGSGGSLPFTGAELGVLAGAGGILVLLGFSLRRMTHGSAEA
jgi:hypothetical protein